MVGNKANNRISTRLLALALALVTSFALVACGGLPDLPDLSFLDPTPPASSTSADEQAAPAPAVAPEPAPIDLSPKTGAGMDHGLAYDCLTPMQRAGYDHTLIELRAAPTEFTLDLSADDAETVYYAVRDDHPELFWVEGYTYYDYGDHVKIEPYYVVDRAEIEVLSARIDEICDPIVEEAAAKESTYEQVKAFYEWIILNTDYEAQEADQNILGVFLDHRAVCAGYSRAFEHLCRRLRIPCGIVTGELEDGEAHSWCLVTIDGVNTYVDVTWGDPFLVDDLGESTGNLSHQYLCLTTEEILRDRTATRPENGLPSCDSHAYDYYALRGCYVEDWGGDGYGMDAYISDAIARGEYSVAVKFAREEDFEAARWYVESGDIWYSELSEVAWQYRYSTNDYLRILELSWE